MIAAVSSLALAIAGVLGPQESSAVRAEWEVRRAALSTEPALSSAFESEDWRRRFRALDALARRRPSRIEDVELAHARVALRDEHPNVRAEAFEVFARHGQVLPLDVIALDDEIAEVRRSYARALGTSPGAEATARLAQLVHDEDPDVAREARASLFSRGSRARSTQLALLRDEAYLVDAGAYLHILEVLDRSPADEILLREVGEGAGGAKTRLRGARAALWSALSAETGVSYAGAERDLVSGWFETIGPPGSTLERKRRERLREGARHTSIRVARGLLEYITATPPPSIEVADELVRDAVRIFFDTRESAGLWPEWFGPREDWPDELALSFWETTLGRETSWGASHPEDPGWEERWLADSTDPDTRDAAFLAFADTWERTGDAGSAAILIGCLQDSALAREAYASLVDSAKASACHAEVAGWWRALPVAERIELLRLHRRGVAYPAWREGLIELWESGEGRSVSVPELLAAFEGDPEVAASLAKWFELELQDLEDGIVPAEEIKRGPWREAEARAGWLLAAWSSVVGEERVAKRREWLLRVGQLGKELGKKLVADLVKSGEGKRACEDVLASPLLSRRLRFEILLLDRDIEDARELGVLIAAYPTCDEELQLRILKRSGGLDDEGVRRFLAAVLLDRGSGPAQRLVAVGALASAGPPAQVVRQLARVLRESADLEVRRAVIAEIAALARSLDGLGLRELHDDPEAREYLGDELLPALVRIDLRADGVLSPDLEELWAQEIGERAVGELGSRFHGERLPAREFVYSGWLAAAEALARHGVLETALPENWWGWDGRLLLKLASLVRNAGATPELARHFEHAALVALEGEATAPDLSSLSVLARAHLLEAALDAEEWLEAEGWANRILADWRAGRTTPNAFRSVFGSRDADQGRDPLHWLFACEAQSRAFRALEAGELEEARRLAREALSRIGDSRSAAKRQLELERALATEGG